MAKLPVRSLGGYLPYWHVLRISSIPTQYNTIYLFSARPVGGTPGANGSVFFQQGSQPIDQFKTELKAFRNSGRCAILSVGGAGEFIRLDTRGRTINFVNSITAIYTQLGGFDGLDWNLESSEVVPSELVWASQQLKDSYGVDFAITIPPAPWRVSDVALVRALNAVGVLDLVSPQYYDLTGLATEAARRHHAINNLQQVWLPAVGGDPSKLGFGFKNVGAAADTMTPATCADVWEASVALDPRLRGAFVWELAADASIGNAFANRVGQVVLGKVDPPPEKGITMSGLVAKSANSSCLVAGIDVVRGADQLVAYSNRQTISPANEYGAEAAVLEGRVTVLADRQSTRGLGNTVPSWGFVLSGHGAARRWLLANAKVGTAITMQIQPLSEDATLAQVVKAYNDLLGVVPVSYILVN